MLRSALRPPPAEGAPHVYSVEELGLYLGMLLEGDPNLQDVWLRGEVSNLSRSPAGHYYFCLKDPSGQVKCVLFRGSAARSPVLPEHGQAVVAHGQVRFYARQGLCELVADLLFPEGVGLAQMRFEALYRRLDAEGLFDQARKRPLPHFPRRIGAITSDGGAVIHDLLTVLGRRYPVAEVVFVPTPVQGEGAVVAMAAALRGLCLWRGRDGSGVDVVILARGGGSAEDLAPFNDERLVRAVFGSPVPVVSAVGHETDVTLADLAADLRAPTPSAAAELVAPDLGALQRELRATQHRAWLTVQHILEAGHADCEVARAALVRKLARRLELIREQLAGRQAQLAALSPERTLGRGYAVVEIDGRVVRDASGVRPGQQMLVRLQRGRVDGTVTGVHPVR